MRDNAVHTSMLTVFFDTLFFREVWKTNHRAADLDQTSFRFSLRYGLKLTQSLS